MTYSALIAATPTPVYGTPNGVLTAFPLTDGDENVLAVNVSTVFRTDWQGTNQLSPVPRVNQVPASQQIGNSAWTLANSIVLLNATLAPDGSLTTTFLAETAVTNVFTASVGTVVPANSTNTASIFLQASTRTAALLQWADGSSNGVQVAVDLVGLTVTPVAIGTGVLLGATITPYPSGWYRITLSGGTGNSATATSLLVGLQNPTGTSSYAGTAGLGLYVWGAQLEVGTVATPYLANAASPILTTDYAVTSPAPRTNLLPFANILSSTSAWTYTQCAQSVAPTTIYAPDGNNTSVWLITLSTTTNSYFTNQAYTKSLAGRTVTASVYISMGTLAGAPITLWLRDGAENNVQAATFDFAAYTATAMSPGNIAPTMTWCGGGWWRCTVTGLFPTGAAAGLHFYIDPTDGAPNNGQTYYVYDPQVEYGAVATSFIATTLNATTVPGSSTVYGAGVLTFPIAPAAGVSLTWTGNMTYIYNAAGDTLPLWEQTILSQYANSPILLALISSLHAAIDPTVNINSFYTNIWDIYTAQGYGLDVWGRIVGVTRVLNVGAGSYFGFEGTTGPFNASGDSFGGGPAPTGANSWYSGQTTTTNYSLSDNAFRTLILAKAFANVCNGSIPAINQILVNLFITPVAGRTGNFYCTDGEAMTMTYTSTLRPVLTPVEVAIVSQSGVLPRPTGVFTQLVQI